MTMNSPPGDAPSPSASSSVFLRPDVLAGVMFMAIAGIGLAVSWDYPIGTAVRMGTGYVPRLFLWILFALGMVVLLLGLRGSGEEGEGDPPLQWRPLLLIPASQAAFALAISDYGFVIAGLAMILIGGVASRESRWLEVVISAILLVFFVWAIFVWALGLVIPVWPGG
jgi:hypothetical protein